MDACAHAARPTGTSGSAVLTRVTGELLVCATPIGNLGDVTGRVLDALRDADVVLAEDTRVTVRLFARFGITTPLERYDEHTARVRTPELVGRMARGARVALVSDAGTPGISDPGVTLVSACIDADVPVTVLPGPSAITTALVASGLPTHAFYFGGFLPRKAGERSRFFATVAALDATLVFYESPRRVASALAVIAEAFPLRRCAVARELTKMHEEVVRGTTGEVARDFAARETVKGEIVVLVGPPTAEEGVVPEPDDAVLAGMVAERMGEGMSRRDAVKRVAEATGVARNRVYDAATTRDAR